MLNWTMPKVAILAEQFAVIRRDCHIRVARQKVKQFFHHSVEVLHGINLPVPKSQ
jgi:hypothetical protein